MGIYQELWPGVRAWSPGVKSFGGGGTYREVAHAHGVSEQTLEADGPASDATLGVPPVALHARQAGIAAQAVLTATALQVGAVELCGTCAGRTQEGVPPDSLSHDNAQTLQKPTYQDSDDNVGGGAALNGNGAPPENRLRVLL